METSCRVWGLPSPNLFPPTSRLKLEETPYTYGESGRGEVTRTSDYTLRHTRNRGLPWTSWGVDLLGVGLVRKGPRGEWTSWESTS